MKPVFQKVIDNCNGDCMKACVCSLLELDTDTIPNFFCDGPEKFYEHYNETLESNGYEDIGMLHNQKYSYVHNPTLYCFEPTNFVHSLSLDVLYERTEPYFIASVLSPTYFNFTDGIHQTHAVICDKYCNIVHDPNPNYENIIEYPLAQLIGYNGILNVCLINKKIKMSQNRYLVVYTNTKKEVLDKYDNIFDWIMKFIDKNQSNVLSSKTLKEATDYFDILLIPDDCNSKFLIDMAATKILKHEYTIIEQKQRMICVNN